MMNFHEMHTFQAVCDRCGWHTREYGNRPTVERMAKSHEPVCPVPVLPRNGMLMECGCWWWGDPGSTAGLTKAFCSRHGEVIAVEANVSEPAEGERPDKFWTLPALAPSTPTETE